MTERKPLTDAKKLREIWEIVDGMMQDYDEERKQIRATLEASSAKPQGEIVTIRYHVSDLGADGLVKYYSLSQCWNKEHFESKYLMRKPEEYRLDGETEERLMVLLPVKEGEKKLEKEVDND